MSRFAFAALAVTLFAGPSLAEDRQTIIIRNHAFEPKEVHAAPNTPFELKVINKDSSAEEFESHSLKVEKIIPGGKEAVFRIRPLKPGRYGFFGEFHPETGQGTVVVK